MTKKSGEESSESGAQAHCRKQPAITASFASLTPLDMSSKRHWEMTNAIKHYFRTVF